MLLKSGSLVSDRYKIIDKLGEGGMGAVFKAYDLSLEQEVALKTLTPMIAQDEGTRRFRREFRAVARLKHPNIVSVYNFGTDDGLNYFTMEYVEGEDLKKLCEKLVDTEKESGVSLLPKGNFHVILDIFAQVCRAVKYIHSQGIIHRDLKPGNIMITDDGEVVKIMDFGLAKLIDVSVNLTQTGSIMGTAAYMSPEQARGLEVDSRSDLYSLGIILYEVFTGRLPFEGDNPISVIFMHVTEMPIEPHQYNPDIPPELERTILRLLEKEPIDRYQSAGELLAAIEKSRPSLIIPREEIERRSIAELAMPDRIFKAKLIGRERELEELKGYLDKVLMKKGELVLIGGEVGVGKTRLVEELRGYGRLKGAKFLTGRCYEQEGSISYQPFIEAFRQYFRDVRLHEDLGNVRRMIKGLEPELVKLIPDISEIAREVTPSVKLTPEQEKSRLFDAVYRFLVNISERNPIVILLDDLQWADEMTLQLLHYIARNIRNDRILLCGTYREEEVSVGRHPLAELMRRMSRERILQRISLARLSLEEVQQMLYSLLGTKDLSSDFEMMIYEETEGNPFFIEEVIKSLVEEGVLYLYNGVWKKKMETIKIEIPPTISDVVERRLDSLDEEKREFMSIAAVIGKEFDFDVLMEVSGRDEDELLDIIDELLRTRLIGEDKASKGDRYYFAHVKIREVLYEEINARRRRRLHRKIGEVIEGLYEDKLEEYVGELAYHFYRGEHREKAIEYSLRAGERAKRIYANEEAIRFYRMAIELLEKSGNNLEQRIDLMGELGNLYDLVGEYDMAFSSYEEALSLTSDDPLLVTKRVALNRNIGDTYRRKGEYNKALEYLNFGLDELEEGDDEIEASKIMSNMGVVYERKGRYDKSVECQLRALEFAQRQKDTGQMAQAYNNLGITYYRKGEWDKASGYFKQSLEMRESIKDIQGVADSYHSLGFIYLRKSELDKAIECTEKGLEIRKKIGDMDGIARSHNALGNIYLDRRDHQKALLHYEKSLAMMERMGDARGAALALNNLGVTYAASSKWNEALKNYEKSLEISEGIGATLEMALACNNLGEIYLKKGELSRSIEYYRRSIELKEEIGNYSGVAYSSSELGMVYFEMMECDKAIECYQRALEISERLGYTLVMIRAYHSLAEVYAELGDLEEAEKHCQRALELSANLDDKLELGKGYRIRAKIDKLKGEVGRALQHFEESIAILKEINDVYNLGKTYYEFGLYLEGIRDRDKSLDYLQEALSIFERLGAKLTAKRAREKVEELEELTTPESDQ